MLLKLLIGHALADMVLQPAEMAKGKNRHKKPDYIPEGQKFCACWPYWLSAHALTHGAAVWIATGSMMLCVFEIVVHWIIDFLKCENITNPHVDQALHVLCKVIYVVLYVNGIR
jgi:hypothetical protein